MPQQKRKRIKRNPPKGSTREKGDMVEQIVAIMHEEPGVHVGMNEYLPALDGSGRTREIDVLLTSNIGGYPVRMAIECKNERKLVNIAEIDKFIGHMEDVGIPTQQCIFVSVSGYTSDATLRAQKAGIKTLIFRDLMQELPKATQEALQSLIFLLASITDIQFTGDLPNEISAGLALFFRNKDGKMCGIPDLVWEAWQTRQISDRLGANRVPLELPADWVFFQGNQVPQTKNIVANVQVTAHLITISAPLTHQVLFDAKSQGATKFNLQAEFQRPQGNYQVTTVSSEEELETLKNKHAGVNIFAGRFRLPRIRWGPIYWPPNDKALKKLFTLAVQSVNEGKEFDMMKIPLSDIEGSDMNTLWEPIWKEHPAARNTQHS